MINMVGMKIIFDSGGGHLSQVWENMKASDMCNTEGIAFQIWGNNLVKGCISQDSFSAWYKKENLAETSLSKKQKGN